MSKYGNCFSMRAILESNYKELNDLLDVKPFTKFEKEQIKSIFRDISFYLCQSNAHAVAAETVFIDLLGRDTYQDFVAKAVKGEVYKNALAESFNNTYPFGAEETYLYGDEDE